MVGETRLALVAMQLLLESISNLSILCSSGLLLL